MDNFEEQLTQLLDSGDTAGAKKLIEDLLAEPLDDKQRGEIAFNKAMVFIRAKNELNKTYLAKAKEILAELNELDKLQNETDRDQKIGDIRNQISKL